MRDKPLATCTNFVLDTGRAANTGVDMLTTIQTGLELTIVVVRSDAKGTRMCLRIADMDVLDTLEQEIAKVRAAHKAFGDALKPKATEMPHEADSWIAEQWMGKTVREVAGTCNLGRTGTVVETITDEKGALHCRVETGITSNYFWCPGSCLAVEG